MLGDWVPIIEASVDTTKLLPFFKLFENKVAGFMTASASFPLFYQDKELVRKTNTMQQPYRCCLAVTG
jgi:hypothetical protein